MNCRNVWIVMLAACTLATAAAGAEDSAQVSPQRRSQVALADYYECVKTYAMKFAPTTALASEVAEAALSACTDSGHELFSANMAFTNSMDTASRLDVLAKESARRWAIQTLLESRFQIKSPTRTIQP